MLLVGISALPPESPRHGIAPVILWLSPAAPNHTLLVSGANFESIAATRLCLGLDPGPGPGQCLEYRAPTPDDRYRRWPAQIRIRIPATWPLARYRLELLPSNATLAPARATANGAVVHWWHGDQGGACGTARNGFVRIFGGSLLLRAPAASRLVRRHTYDDRSYRHDEMIGLRFECRSHQCGHERCGGNATYVTTVPASRADGYSAEFPLAVVPGGSNCTMVLMVGARLATEAVALDGVLSVMPAPGIPRVINVEPSNSTALYAALEGVRGLDPPCGSAGGSDQNVKGVETG